MEEQMKTITESKRAKNFFKKVGLEIMKDSCFNVLFLKNTQTGEVLEITADVKGFNNIPGIFVEMVK